MPQSDEDMPGRGLAVAAESFYLVNLLLVPVVGFLILLWIWWKHHETAPPLARSHLAQTLSGSIWAGLLLVVANALILLLGGYEGPHVWVVVITYFTFCHSMFICFGAYGLAKAMAAQCWRYPLVGRPLPDGCLTRN